MKYIKKRQLSFLIICLFSILLLVSGCTELTPVDPTPSAPSSPIQPAKPPLDTGDVKITYNYGATDKVQLSANYVTVKVGQKLILEPALGLNTNTRFTSSGENFFGTIMKQETNGSNTSRATFIAIAPGKGKLTIIPNTNDVDRATDLWVTTQ